MRAIILAGGLGTRLRPVTDTLPKALVPVGEYPMIELQIRKLRSAGFDRVTLCVGHLSHMIMERLGDGAHLGIAIDYVHDLVPLGTAGPLRRVPDWRTSALVMNCDVLCAADLGALYRTHRRDGAVLTVGSTSSEMQLDVAVLDVAEDRGVRGIREKPRLSVDIAAGIYVLEPDVREFLPAGTRIDMPTLIGGLVAAGRPVRAAPVAGAWYDVGTPAGYEAARHAFEAAPAGFLDAAATSIMASDLASDLEGGLLDAPIPSTPRRQ